MLGAYCSSDQIKAEAIRIIAECGFDAMSLRTLAAACGITPAAIYTHFSSKHVLLHEVIMEFLEDLLHNWRFKKKAGGSPSEKLKMFIESYVEYQAAHPSEQRVFHFDKRSLQPAARHRVEFLMDEFRHELQILLEAGKADESFSLDDAVFVARTLQEVMTQICVTHTERGSCDSRKIIGAVCLCAQGLTGSHRPI
ncbi:hypothetical protein D9M69_369520 [compost metagenome]